MAEDDDDDFRFSIESADLEPSPKQAKQVKLARVLERKAWKDGTLITYSLGKYDHVIDIERRLEIVDRIIQRVLICARTSAFSDIFMHAQLVRMVQKNCLLLNTIVKNKQRKLQLESFNRIKSHTVNLDRHTGRALAKLTGVMFSKSMEHNVAFLNELELLSLAYELIFRRMKTIQWKENVRFSSFSSLVRTYLQTLWMKHPDKYEYVQDLAEKNHHIYTVFVDDLLTWHYDRSRKVTLAYAIHRIKNFDRLRLRKLDKLVRIFRKYNSKATKVHLMDFMRKVNAVRPKESLLYVLHGLFSYHHLLGLQEGFNKIKLCTEAGFKRDRDQRNALTRLKCLFDKKLKDNSRAIPVRTFFPIRDEVNKPQAAKTLFSTLRTCFRKRATDAFNDLRYFRVPQVITEVEEEHHTITKVEHKLKVIKYKGVELIESALSSLLQRRLSHPFRRLIEALRNYGSNRDRVFDTLSNLFFKRLFAGFNLVKEKAKKVKEKRLIIHREALTTLDSLFKNRYNQAFSQVKAITIELQILTVMDTTNVNKLMFCVKDILNTSGNLSGNWDDVLRMSGGKPQGMGSNRMIPRDLSPVGIRGSSPSKVLDRGSVGAKPASKPGPATEGPAQPNTQRRGSDKRISDIQSQIQKTNNTSNMMSNTAITSGQKVTRSTVDQNTSIMNKGVATTNNVQSSVSTAKVQDNLTSQGGAKTAAPASTQQAQMAASTKKKAISPSRMNVVGSGQNRGEYDDEQEDNNTQDPILGKITSTGNTTSMVKNATLTTKKTVSSNSGNNAGGNAAGYPNAERGGNTGGGSTVTRTTTTTTTNVNRGVGGPDRTSNVAAAVTTGQSSVRKTTVGSRTEFVSGGGPSSSMAQSALFGGTDNPSIVNSTNKKVTTDNSSTGVVKGGALDPQRLTSGATNAAVTKNIPKKGTRTDSSGGDLGYEADEKLNVDYQSGGKNTTIVAVGSNNLRSNSRGQAQRGSFGSGTNEIPSPGLPGGSSGGKVKRKAMVTTTTSSVGGAKTLS